MLKKPVITFDKAIPVWIQGREREMNLWLSLRAVAGEGGPARLRVTGHAAYSVRVDGELIAFGPAKCGEGYYRVDDIDLTGCITHHSVITITVAGYNCICGCLLDEPSFICAELIENGQVTAATGHGGFDCRIVTEHVQKAQRYSNQRTFGEVYDMTPASQAWYTDAHADMAPYEAAALSPAADEKRFIARECGYHTFPRVFPEVVVSRETFSLGNKTAADITYPSYMRPQTVSAFPQEEIRLDTYLLYRNLITGSSTAAHDRPSSERLTQGQAVTYKWHGNTSGAICMHVTCRQAARILILFEEYLTPDNELIHYGSIHNCVVWDLQPGDYDLSTFEPYALQALRLYVLRGEVDVGSVFVQYFGAEQPDVAFTGSDDDLRTLYAAALETYRQNTFTIFMDCPSRERAGFLCDSFFTARVEYLLTGKNEIEHNFLQNFFMPDRFHEEIPEGLFPCCYPSHAGLLNNWVMWLVIELREYFERTHDDDFRLAICDRLMQVFAYYAKYENADGLLEKPDGWVWVDGDKTKCSELVQDVSYPTNVLYAHAIEAMGRMYDLPAFLAKAAAIKATAERQAYMPDKGFYCDNAVRGEDGLLHLSGEATETCQYYFFYFDATTPDKRPELWQRLQRDFGPKRVVANQWPSLKAEAAYPHIFPSNMLIGNQLRLSLLFRYAGREQFLSELKGYYLPMARLTGTLWEHDTDKRSCSHAFTSHLLCWLYELGMIRRHFA